jgi:Uma2 family endonuclease
VEPILHLSDQAFMDLCQVNPLVNLERSAHGELIAMAPSGAQSGQRNLSLGMQIGEWNRKTNLGSAFGSAPGFRLRNSAIRSPDASWVSKGRRESLTKVQREQFAPLCPDFVAEIASPDDDLGALRARMREYVEHGARLGWLIDPYARKVEIYRPDCAVEILHQPAGLTGEDVLPGLIVDLSEILDG